MSTVIGVYDEEAALHASLRRLHEAGVESRAITVLDPLAHPPGAGEAGKTPGAGDAVLPGAAPSIGHPGVAAEPPDGEATREAESVLRERLPSEVGVDFYTRVLEHDGRVLVVDAAAGEAERVVALMKECGAARTDLHD